MDREVLCIRVRYKVSVSADKDVIELTPGRCRRYHDKGGPFGAKRLPHVLRKPRGSTEVDVDVSRQSVVAARYGQYCCKHRHESLHYLLGGTGTGVEDGDGHVLDVLRYVIRADISDTVLHQRIVNSVARCLTCLLAPYFIALIDYEGLAKKSAVK